VCEGGAGVHPQGGAEGGAEVTVCEGNSRGSQPSDRASSLSPRYQRERSTKWTFERPEGLGESWGPRVVPGVRGPCSRVSAERSPYLVSDVSEFGDSCHDDQRMVTAP